MTDYSYSSPTTFRGFLIDKLLMGLSPSEYLKSLLTPFNIIAGLIVLVGIPITVIRFTQGLASVTNLSDTNPWGLWIGFDMLCGVALAAGGFVIGSAVYLFGRREYHMLVRPAVLTGFLGYFFAVVGLLYDLGQPWRLPYPMFVSFGITSVMFLVAWHVALYLSVQFVEWCPAIWEWLGLRRIRLWIVRLTIGATIFGAVLSTLHQSALGALFLLTPTKLHPLWYSSFLPVFFFISAIAAGICMLIFESMLTHRIFSDQVSHVSHAKFDRLTVGLGRAAALTLISYFCLKIIGLAHDNRWHLLATKWGAWYLVEMLGFVLLPCVLFVAAARANNARLTRFASVIAIIGIVLNRLNVSIIAFNWNVADKYYPHWMEYVISITIVTVGLLTFRAIVNRMPILWSHPHYETH
jgi:Ni/Fe-hydrogenase subunit HybB-like protein